MSLPRTLCRRLPSTATHAPTRVQELAHSGGLAGLKVDELKSWLKANGQKARRGSGALCARRRVLRCASWACQRCALST